MNYKMVFHIIGRILLVEALLLAVPLAVSLIYREDIILAYVLPILLLIATGLVLGYKQPKNSAIYAKEGFFVVSLSWIVISLFGALPVLAQPGQSLPIWTAFLKRCLVLQRRARAYWPKWNHFLCLCCFGEASHIGSAAWVSSSLCWQFCQR